MKKFFTFITAALFAGSMMAANLYEIDFTAEQGEWTINNVTLPEGSEFVWAQDAKYGMKATAYFQNAAHTSEAWLISPALDLSAVESATLLINHAMNKGNNTTLAVKASIDGENWEAVELSEWPAGTNWNFLEATADLAAYVGKASVQIAFVYASSEANCPTWEIKTVAVGDGGVTPPVQHFDTLTVAEAVAIAEALAEPESGKSTYSDKEVVVAGYAVKVYDKNDDGTWSFYMADEEGAKGNFMASKATADADVEENDFIFLKGTICKYKAQSSGNIILQIYKGTATHGEPMEGVENVVLTEKAQKVMMNGTLYIIRGNKMFDVRGAQVR